MYIMFNRRTIVQALLAAVITLQTARPADVKAFTGARLFDGTGKPAIDNAVILVRDGKIEAAAANHGRTH